jgi:predicted kinase
MPIMTIVRGLPGSGKSTFAKSLGVFHLEADQFHMVDGKYDWKGYNIKSAHSFIKKLAGEIMNVGSDLVISNTFTQYWEFEDYIKLAHMKGYTVVVVRCTHVFGNVHNVPEDAIEKMRNRFEDYTEEVYWHKGAFIEK